MQMPSLGRIFAGDEELGKKNDDHRPPQDDVLPSVWPARTLVLRPRKRNIVYAMLACLGVYLFIRNMPTDLVPNSQRGDSRIALPRIVLPFVPASSSDRPARSENPSEAEEYYFDGPFKFYRLGASLHAVARLAGRNGVNKNVLFAASSLKSASEVIPVACEMAKWERNDVHFAILGREDLDLEQIRAINGVGSDCNVHWHDARPDFSRWSSAHRMELAVAAGMTYIHAFILPQVILTNDPGREDAFFTKVVRGKAFEFGKSIIELPPDAPENLLWLTRLDSGSLAAWHTTYVDLLIHAPPDSSGSLIRLLKSIEAANYFGSRRPHLTIELPANVDQPTWDFVKNLIWPPLDWSGAPHASQVTLRHRIPRRILTTEEASLHLVESFYPARPKDSHVLLLSPQIELSPLYYHYLMYNLLEYKYSSSYSQQTLDTKNLMGISLELPSHHLNDSEPFTPPFLERPKVKGISQADGPTPFLWQSPNSNAALYFGDKWIQLHSFLAARISAQDSKIPSQLKAVSEKYPSWLEYLWELMRARGYFLLYPNFPSGSDSIATLHNELYQVHEEFSRPHPTSALDRPLPTISAEESFIPDPSTYSLKPPSDPEKSLLTTNLLSSLPYSGDLSDISYLPLLSHQGNLLSHSESEILALAFTTNFRHEIGGCTTANMKKLLMYPMSATDLFCNLEDPFTIDEKSTEVPNDTSNEESLSPNHPPTRPAVQQDNSEFSQAEFAAHLNRQGGAAARAAPPVPIPNPAKDESSEGRAQEFADQMTRQQKAAPKKAFTEDSEVVAREKKQPGGGSLSESQTTTDKLAGKKGVVETIEDVYPIKKNDLTVKKEVEGGSKKGGEGDVVDSSAEPHIEPATPQEKAARHPGW